MIILFNNKFHFIGPDFCEQWLRHELARVIPLIDIIPLQPKLSREFVVQGWWMEKVLSENRHGCFAAIAVPLSLASKEGRGWSLHVATVDMKLGPLGDGTYEFIKRCERQFLYVYDPDKKAWVTDSSPKGYYYL